MTTIHSTVPEQLSCGGCSATQNSSANLAIRPGFKKAYGGPGSCSGTTPFSVGMRTRRTLRPGFAGTPIMWLRRCFARKRHPSKRISPSRRLQVLPWPIITPESTKPRQNHSPSPSKRPRRVRHPPTECRRPQENDRPEGGRPLRRRPSGSHAGKGFSGDGVTRRTPRQRHRMILSTRSLPRRQIVPAPVS